MVKSVGPFSRGRQDSLFIWRLRSMETVSLAALSAIAFVSSASAKAIVPDGQPGASVQSDQSEKTAPQSVPVPQRRGAQASVAAQATSGSAVSSTSTVGEVVVTARRVSERLQDIPASVSAVTGEKLSSLGSLNDLQSSISGVTFKSEGPVPIVAIRGFGNRPVLTGPNTTVGIFQDGVFIAPFLNVEDSQIDVARIEVAKGPQSTLYGRSTYTGAINIVTADPTSTPTGYVEGGVGGSSSYGEGLYDLRGVVAGPITDTLSGRFFLLREERDGYTYDPVTHYRGYGYDRVAGRAKLMWEPTNDLKVRLAATIVHDNDTRGDVNSGKLQAPLGQAAEFGDPAVTPIYKFGPNIWTGNFLRPNLGYIDGQEGTLDVRYQSPIGELASLSDYTHSKTQIQSNVGTSTADVVDAFGDTSEDRFSQELRLSGKADRFTYLVGLYYLYTDFKFGDPGTTLNLNAPFARFYPGSAPYDEGIQEILTPTTTRTNAYAAFAQLGYNFTDKLNLTLGIREGRDMLNGVTSETFLFQPGLAVPIVPQTGQRAKFDATTGSANLNYKFARDILGYVSFSRGDSPGGFNTGAAALLNYAPQTVDAYEVGIKSLFLNRRLQFNAAFFNNDYHNLQFFQAIVLNGVATQVTLNAAQATGRGIDMDAVAVLSSNWRAALQYTYQSSEITSYTVPALPAPQVNFRGVPLVRSPRDSLNVSLTYTSHIGPGRFEFTPEESYTSRYINDYTGVPTGTAYPGRPGVPAGVTSSQVLGLYPTAGYALTDLNASYTVGQWQISAFVRNLLNKQYIVAAVALDAISYPNQTPGEPRTFEVRLKKSF